MEQQTANAAVIYALSIGARYPGFIHVSLFCKGFIHVSPSTLFTCASFFFLLFLPSEYTIVKKKKKLTDKLQDCISGEWIGGARGEAESAGLGRHYYWHPSLEPHRGEVDNRVLLGRPSASAVGNI